MSVFVSLALILHVLSTTFWAGSTFTLARTGGKGADGLFGPQMGAAGVAVATGGYLWAVLFGHSPGHSVLGIGAAVAVLAAIVQGSRIGPVRKRIATDAAALACALRAHQIASGLFVVAVACMVIQ